MSTSSSGPSVFSGIGANSAPPHLDRVATQRLWASVGLAVVVLHGLPHVVSVLVLAFFIATSPYYPTALVHNLVAALPDPPRPEEGVAPTADPMAEVWRLGRRWGTWR